MDAEAASPAPDAGPAAPDKPEGAPADELITIPLSTLGAEIEFALAYTLACGVGQGTDPLTRRKAVVAHMAAVLAERADNGVAGMSIRRV